MKLRHIALAVAALLAAAPVSAKSASPNQGLVVKEDKPGLLARATVRPEAALRAALTRVPGGQLKEAEIEIERRRLVYSFELAVAGQKGLHEVLVDAKTGAVVKIEHEDDDSDDDTDEDTDDKEKRRPA